MASQGVINFSTSESKMQQTVADIEFTELAIHELFVDETTQLPFHFRTGQQTLGDVGERKRFKYIEFHGAGVNPGTLRVRVYIDGRYVCDGNITMTETPDKKRRVNVPIGRQIGYTIDVECAGVGNLRLIEFTFDSTNSQS
jgi:hypothetical protein